jgi:hypothetical protein
VLPLQPRQTRSELFVAPTLVYVPAAQDALTVVHAAEYVTAEE